MNPKLTVKMRVKVISDFNGIMTVALLADDSLCHIFAGDSYQIIHLLEKLFKER